MKTLGQTLRHSREKRGVALSQLAKATRIPEHFLAALEEERFDQLPALTLVQGYVKLVAHELDLNEETALALLRRDLPPIMTGTPHKRLRGQSWKERVVSPRFLSLSFLGISFLVLASVLAFQWQRLGQPPKLEVTTPQNALIVKSPVQVVGTASPNSTLMINTQQVSLDPQGNFTYDLELPPGERAIVIQALDHRSRKSERIFFVTVEP